MSNALDIKLASGLYLVATPIGTARDITLRALDILANADLLVAEDTRQLKHLMQLHGIALGTRQVISYHDHNGAQQRPRIMAALQAGQAVAYTSDAGTPLIADPGYDLVKEARQTGYHVTSAPGPSAVITALSIAGLPTDRFCFMGFAPATSQARRKVLQEAATIPASLVFYETAKRLLRFLEDACDILGPNRRMAICRELTKKFEDIQSDELQNHLQNADQLTLKGEFVLIIERQEKNEISEIEIDRALSEALERSKVKQAAEEIAMRFSLSKRDMYQRALRLKEEQ